MKLTIDIRAARSGLGTYINNLIQNLTIPRDYIVRPDQFLEFGGTVSQAPIYSIREQWEIPRICRTPVLHSPHYNAPLAFRGSLIVTIHDVIHLQAPSHRWKALCYAWPILLAVSRRADHVITVSELSKRAIMDYLHVPESRISVILNGVKPQTPKLTGRDDYLLFVGNIKPHKNLKMLIAAMDLLPNRRLKVIGVGDAPPPHPSNVEFLGPVPDVAPYYRDAALTILPSKFEGFGLPVLEALSHGCPVACSSFLSEIGGPFASYFDPDSPDDIAAAIERASYHPETPQWLQRFSWQDSARKHEDIYRKFGGIEIS